MVLLMRIIAFFIATLIWALGFKRKVIHRNLELMRRKSEKNFRWWLTFCATYDLLVFISGKTPSFKVHRGSEVHLHAMRKRSCLLLTAHFHNWELLANGLMKEGIPLLAAARTLQSPRAESILQRLRKNIGVQTVNEQIPRAALRHVQEGGCFAVLWDQHSPHSDCSSWFSELSVNMNPLPIFILTHHRCPVYFGFMINNRLRVIHLLSRFEGHWEDKLMRRYNRVLEALIHMHPEFWYGFFHARFKNIALYSGHRSSMKLIPNPA